MTTPLEFSPHTLARFLKNVGSLDALNEAMVKEWGVPFQHVEQPALVTDFRSVYTFKERYGTTSSHFHDLRSRAWGANEAWFLFGLPAPVLWMLGDGWYSFFSVACVSPLGNPTFVRWKECYSNPKRRRGTPEAFRDQFLRRLRTVLEASVANLQTPDLPRASPEASFESYVQRDGLVRLPADVRLQLDLDADGGKVIFELTPQGWLLKRMPLGCNP